MGRTPANGTTELFSKAKGTAVCWSEGTGPRLVLGKDVNSVDGHTAPGR